MNLDVHRKRYIQLISFKFNFIYILWNFKYKTKVLLIDDRTMQKYANL